VSVRWSIGAVAVALVVLVPTAWGGSSIKTRPDCENSYLILGGSPTAASQSEFRAALLCLINAARKAERLPALERSTQLESVAREQSDEFAKTGVGSHGSSLSDIAKRDAAKGYHAAAYNEGYEDLGPGATPYGFLAHMLSRSGVPCSEIFDPRFREVGIGTNAVTLLGEPQIYTLALEFGLRVGQRQPATNTQPADSCPHAMPTPIVTGVPIAPGSAPAAQGATVTVGLTCTATLPCVLTATLKLPDANAQTATDGSITIPAGGSMQIPFTFTASAVQAELAAPIPNISLTVTLTVPVKYTTTLNGPLTAAGSG
jgi:hypothetical protein